MPDDQAQGEDRGFRLCDPNVTAGQVPRSFRKRVAKQRSAQPHAGVLGLGPRRRAWRPQRAFLRSNTSVSPGPGHARADSVCEELSGGCAVASRGTDRESARRPAAPPQSWAVAPSSASGVPADAGRHDRRLPGRVRGTLAGGVHGCVPAAHRAVLLLVSRIGQAHTWAAVGPGVPSAAEPGGGGASVSGRGGWTWAERPCSEDYGGDQGVKPGGPWSWMSSGLCRRRVWPERRGGLGGIQ